jgi:[acyl-carrier-protein] S-malonyltransferase
MTPLSFVFPGQGSQAVGMLAPLGERYPMVGQTFAEASAVLGQDLWRLVQEGPEVELNSTRNTQPAMLAAGVAVWRVWRERDGVEPALMAGHSLGEYSALVCAGALELADAVALVAERARLMQEAVPQGQGAMAALLGLEDDQVRAVCVEAAAGEVVEAVNLNAPGQVVVAGHASAVERAIHLAKAAGAKRVLLLPVSVPSHCALMRPAAAKLAERLARTPIGPPRIPVLHNASVEATGDPGQIRALLALQLYRPVRWVETIRAMASQGIARVVEAGPGKVLTGLNKRIDKAMRVLPVFDPRTLDTALEETSHAA